MLDKTNKVVRGFSLSAENIEWVRARAFALSTAAKRLSDSQFLDNLITAKRKELEKRKEGKHTWQRN